MSIVRTGIVALTLLVKSICRILTTYRPAIDTVLAAAVTAGTITSGQKSTIDTWLDGAQAACQILRTVTEY